MATRKVPKGAQRKVQTSSVEVSRSQTGVNGVLVLALLILKVVLQATVQQKIQLKDSPIPVWHQIPEWVVEKKKAVMVPKGRLSTSLCWPQERRCCLFLGSILGGVGSFSVTYLDDVLISSHSGQDHLQTLRHILMLEAREPGIERMKMSARPSNRLWHIRAIISLKGFDLWPQSRLNRR